MKVLLILVVAVALVQSKPYSKSGEGVRKLSSKDAVHSPLETDPIEINDGSMIPESPAAGAPAAEWRDSSRAYEDAGPAPAPSYAVPPIASPPPRSGRAIARPAEPAAAWRDSSRAYGNAAPVGVPPIEISPIASPPPSGGVDAGPAESAAGWRDSPRAYEAAGPAPGPAPGPSYAIPPIASDVPISKGPVPAGSDTAPGTNYDVRTFADIFERGPSADANSTTPTHPPTSSDNGVSVASGRASAVEPEHPSMSCNLGPMSPIPLPEARRRTHPTTDFNLQDVQIELVESRAKITLGKGNGIMSIPALYRFF